MFRNKDYNKRRPVNIVRQNKLTRDFRKRGGIVWQDDESEQTKQNLEYWKGELKKYEN